MPAQALHSLFSTPSPIDENAERGLNAVRKTLRNRCCSVDSAAGPVDAPVGRRHWLAAPQDVDHGPDDQTGLVLAGGADLVAERVAGPFDMPWSVALLADGSFLVTERPGHLQHVRPGADTQPVAGIPEVLYVATSDCSTSRWIQNFQTAGSSTSPSCRARRRLPPSRCSGHVTKRATRR